MSICNKLHQQIVEEGDVLSQYDSISTDNKIIESLSNNTTQSDPISKPIATPFFGVPLISPEIYSIPHFSQSIFR